MPDADILLDTNTIELKDGDVSISESLDVNGDITISANNGETIVQITQDGDFDIQFPNSTLKIQIDQVGIHFYDDDGLPSLIIQNNGAIMCLNGDIVMSASTDIKLDGQYLSARLDSIEQRLTNGGL